MYREGHVGVALLAYAPLGFVAATLGAPVLAVAGAVASAGFALLPDVDDYLPLGHRRGVTHTLWFALDVGVVAASFAGARATDAGALAVVAGALFGFLVGAMAVASHVAADALTPPGVEPLWPLQGRTYGYAAGWASARIANYFVLAGGALAAGLALLAGLAVAG